MIRVEQLVVGGLSTNCYFLMNETLQEAVIVDPGDEPERILQTLAQWNARPVAVLLTHGHFDHILGAKRIKELCRIPIYAGIHEKEMLNHAEQNLSEGYVRQSYEIDADVYCRDGDRFTLAGCEITVFETPGHTLGGCVYYVSSEKLAFVGDTLFYECVGRTDLAGGSYEAICQSIREKLFVLPEETVCYCGHGNSTTIRHEKGHNPYVR